jgi:predicted AlkP superfamily pyrophosphatase or phosphodiesterase
MKLLLPPFALALAVASVAQPPTWQDPPRLVVGVVVDQMRTDHIYRYWHHYGEGGFKRLVAEGAFLRDAHFNYMPTFTGPGHASIYTGTTPAHHGITGNNMLFRNTGRSMYCAQDDSVQGVTNSGITDIGRAGQRSPKNLFATSIADELERHTARRSKTIGIAWKDRGAILPIGRTGDAAYWFHADGDGAWVSSSWYMNTLPQWVRDFNARGLPRQYLDRTWDLVLPRDRYTQALPDDNPYEHALPGAAKPTLPQDLHRLSKDSAHTTLLGYTPWSNTLTTDFALAALVGEDMGADAITDLLAISYSAPDILGHAVGLRALELEDMYIRLDREIARLLAALDERMGAGRYTLFLTSDHGAADVPAYMASIKASAGYLEVARMREEINTALSARFGRGPWVHRILNDQVFLSDSLIAARKLDPTAVQRAAADALLRNPLIAEALTATDLQRMDYSEQVRGNVRRGYMAQRSGDVCFVLRPGWFDHEGWANGKGTTHGSPWNYDTHVPILFFGQGVRAGEVLRRTTIPDIAPTISMLIGMPMPDASTGVVVTEILVSPASTPIVDKPVEAPAPVHGGKPQRRR